MFFRTLQQFTHTIGALKNILDKAEAYQAEHDVDLLNARLAPDMFHFIRQIQAVSDTAKFTAARLSGKQAPTFEDTEETYDELRQRLNKTIEYLNSFSPEDFEDAATRQITLPFAKTMWANGEDYFLQFSLPNFFFHTTTAYAILRNHGVDVGKRDFISHMTIHPHETNA